MENSVLSEGIEVADRVPLVVDLDGTLVKTDSLYESFFSSIATNPLGTAQAVMALRSGKAPLKRALAEISDIDYATLPYRESVLTLIEEARAEGRPVILATAADSRHAEGVANHLQLFDGTLSSDGTLNLSSAAKADALVNAYGEGGFDYVGNAEADLKVWSRARNAWTVDASAGVLAKAEKQAATARVLEPRSRSLRPWLKALRIHQYAKNALVFVPLLTSHTFNWPAVGASLLAFLAFCLCASSVYLINDLLDLRSDRSHQTKRRRPIAAGLIKIDHAVFAAPVLLVGAILIAAIVGWPLLGTLAAYFVLTCAYSFFLKRKLLVDVITLALLYTVRIFAGASAIGVEVSHWLLGFSLFLFTSLALIKRYVELASRLDRALPDPSDRNYRLDDLGTIAALAAASGVNAVLVLWMYVADPEVQDNFARPEVMWLMCPILLYWVGRALMMAHRRDMNDDPVVFALTDRNSRLAVICFVAIFVYASFG